jgi:hypothetical protein
MSCSAKYRWGNNVKANINSFRAPDYPGARFQARLQMHYTAMLAYRGIGDIDAEREQKLFQRFKSRRIRTVDYGRAPLGESGR